MMKSFAKIPTGAAPPDHIPQRRPSRQHPRQRHASPAAESSAASQNATATWLQSDAAQFGHRFRHVAPDAGDHEPVELRVGPADDPFEQQADHLAERIVGDLHGDPAAREGAAPVLDVASASDQGGSAGGGPAATVQRSAAMSGDRGGLASPQAAAEVEAAADTGDRLPTPLRQAAERVLGVGLGDLTIHHDRRAERLNQEFDSAAFAYGSHIFMRPDAYAPETAVGQQLLGHEVVHTAQQQSSAPAGPAPPPLVQRNRFSDWVKKKTGRGQASESTPLMASSGPNYGTMSRPDAGVRPPGQPNYGTVRPYTSPPHTSQGTVDQAIDLQDKTKKAFEHNKTHPVDFAAAVKSDETDRLLPDSQPYRNHRKKGYAKMGATGVGGMVANQAATRMLDSTVGIPVSGVVNTGHTASQGARLEHASNNSASPETASAAHQLAVARGKKAASQTLGVGAGTGGAVLGGMAGTAVGGAVGTAVCPGPGTVIGATLGGMAGSAGGGFLAKKVVESGANHLMQDSAENQAAGRQLHEAAMAGDPDAIKQLDILGVDEETARATDGWKALPD